MLGGYESKGIHSVQVVRKGFLEEMMLRQCQSPVGKWILHRECMWRTQKELEGAQMVWLYLTGASFRRRSKDMGIL